MADSQAFTLLSDMLYDDPSQLSQALRQRAGSAQGVHLTTSTESHASFASAPPSTFTVPPHPLLGAVPQLLPAASQHAPFSRRVAANTTHAHHAKSALPKHNSAPAPTAPMTDPALAPKMHHSFAAMDAPGDTQPDSQMHREWTSGIFGTADTTTHIPSPRAGPRSLFAEHDADDDAEPLTDDIEVIVSSQIQQDAAITSPTALEDDRSPYVRTTAEAFTSPFKFETPALAARKRNSPERMLSSTAAVDTTPDTIASASAFGGAFGRSGIGQPLSLTQAFDLTQARTSPAVAGTEDPIFQRPSPNFNNVRHSSPIPTLSSPIKAVRYERSDPIMRSSSEPRSEYVTMKESQERRKHTKGARRASLDQQDSWEELTAAQKRMQRQRRREQTHREADLSWSNISAPAMVKSYGASKRHADISLSPRARHEDSGHIWHDGAMEDEDVAMNDPSQQLKPPDGDDADQSLDELSQSSTFAAQAPMRYNGLENGVQVPKTSSHPQRTQPDHMAGNVYQRGDTSSQLQRESQIQTSASQSILRTAPYSSRGSVAVMDSQPDVTANQESWLRLETRFPSSPSINQYSINQTTVASKTGYTSQMISSSMVRMPPKTSQRIQEEALEEEERVPSSPPMLTDDISYDEHGYDGPSDDSNDHNSNERTADNDDVQMDEEELPIVEHHRIGNEKHAAAGSDQGDVDAYPQSEVTRPTKVNNGTDHEVAETLEEDNQAGTAHNQLIHSSVELDAERPSKPANSIPSLQRQNTIPDTDTLDETQPSYFTEAALPIPLTENETETQENTNTTDAFQTAREQQTASQPHMLAPTSSKDEGSDSVQAVSRIQSLNDIANLPNTQRSAAEEEIEMPRLSGFDDAEGDVHIPNIVPATPAAKRRKTKNAVDRNIFRSPAKDVVQVQSVERQESRSPLKNIQQMCDNPSSASAQKREEQGALAAAQAKEHVQTAAYGRLAKLKSKGPPQSVRPQKNKKGSLKSARAIIATLSSPATSPSKPNLSTITEKSSRRATKSVDKPADVEMRDAGDSTDELASSPQPSAHDLPGRLTPRQAQMDLGEVVVPNRVFASWPGSHYYPATCIGRPDAKHFQVRFDDGNTTSLDAFQVRPLELRLGDQVKVDEPGMKKHTYVTVGLTDKCDDLHNYEFPMTDRYGHMSVILEEKQRDSLPAAKTVPPPKQVTVDIASIYVTTQLWSRLRGRTFQVSPPPSPGKSITQAGTPVPNEAFNTPSFTRRGLAAPSLLKDATNRAGSVASSVHSGSGIFSSMAFVLTSTGDGMDKDAVARAIKSNGGRVLEQGFHELFDTDSIELTASQSRRASALSIEGADLTLKEEFKSLGFVALITDSHSRSTKYLQALALNVPCLHLRWVHDSLATSQALRFARYLLPAGLSKYLDPNGIVRSRAMRMYDPSSDNVSFEKTFKDRDLLLQGQSVLLVTGKSKKEIERRQPFVFLTHALGASNVGRCADLDAAAQLLTQGQWDWVYVDNEQSNVADAAAELFGTSLPTKSAKGSFKKGKKRKRDDGEGADELVVKGDISGHKVRVASAEFVIQSLILGALVDD